MSLDPELALLLQSSKPPPPIPEGISDLEYARIAREGSKLAFGAVIAKYHGERLPPGELEGCTVNGIYRCSDQSLAFQSPHTSWKIDAFRRMIDLLR